MRARAQSQAESLTSKGTSAFGTEFRYGGFPQFTNGSSDRNFTAGIMATEDNTNITIDDYDPLVVFDGIPTFSSPSINITLNEENLCFGRFKFYHCKSRWVYGSKNNF